MHACIWQNLKFVNITIYIYVQSLYYYIYVTTCTGYSTHLQIGGDNPKVEGYKYF